jgi:hypothetical protein
MLLPSLSVGPEPAMISATGILSNVAGVVSVPNILPSVVCKVMVVSTKEESVCAFAKSIFSSKHTNVMKQHLFLFFMVIKDRIIKVLASQQV